MATRYRFDLGSAPAGKLFSVYFIPTLLGMLVESLYILVDGIFVGQGVGALGLGAVNLTWPVFSLFVCFALLMGGGGATLYSIRLGEGRSVEANRIFSMTLFLVVFLIGGLSLLILWKMDAFVRLLGATPNLVPPVKAYMTVLVPFFTPGLMGLVMFCFIRNDGNPRLAMIATVVPSLLNVGLDYTFIFVFRWGMAGAALATGIGWCLSALLCLAHFFRKSRHLRWCRFSLEWRQIVAVASVGFPPFLLEFSIGLTTYMINLSLLRWAGDVGVMAFGIINSLAIQAVMALLALNNALQPLISFNYGAGKPDRVSRFLRIGMGTAVALGFLFFFLACGVGNRVAALFAPGEEGLLALAHRGMMIYFTSFVFCGLNLVIATWYQARERPMPASWIVFLRGVLMVAVGLLVLPPLVGVDGIWWAIPFAEMTTLLFSIWLFLRDGGRKALTVGGEVFMKVTGEGSKVR